MRFSVRVERGHKNNALIFCGNLAHDLNLGIAEALDFIYNWHSYMMMMMIMIPIDSH